MTIKTISHDQAEILHAINALYLNGQGIDLDPMYGKGGFYKNFPLPPFVSDINPGDGLKSVDATALPYVSGHTRSMILDPPFMHAHGKDSAMQRYGTYKSQKELHVLYAALVREAERVLQDGGILIFKCQDTVESGKQVWNHVHVYEIARTLGFEAIDLFVLVAKSRVIGHNQHHQKHARKYHSFFWVFRKKARRRLKGEAAWYQLPLEGEHGEDAHDGDP